jgi:hypothetical protein
MIMLNLFKRVNPFLIFLLLIISFPLPNQIGKAAPPAALNCRFGITTPSNANEIDLIPLKVGALLNWGVISNNNLPAGMDFINVLRVGDRCFDANLHQVSCSKLDDPRSPYQITLDTYEAQVTAHPGMYWIIGNEPDTARSVQDDLTASDYANRYFEIATRIRFLDSTAKIGFGSVVGMTPIRMRYLDLAWSQLVSRAGTQAAASALIDFWAPHGFLLNEIPGGWGSGVPPGFSNDHKDAVRITNFSNSYNINNFSARVESFRSWMKGIGEQNKPLWITEYGNLFPPIDKPGGPDWINVSDSTTTTYMLKTFDFLLNTTDTNTGLPSDNNKLVQRWFWYSLNDYRYNYGGSLFDPDKNPPKETTVGTAFQNYAPKDNVSPDFHLSGNLSLQAGVTDPTQFVVNITVANSGNSMFPQSPRLWFYLDNPNVASYAQVDEPLVMGCGGTKAMSITLPYPGSTRTNKIYLRLDTNGNQTPDDGDDIASFTIPPSPGRIYGQPPLLFAHLFELESGAGPGWLPHPTLQRQWKNLGGDCLGGEGRQQLYRQLPGMQPAISISCPGL